MYSPRWKATVALASVCGLALAGCATHPTAPVTPVLLVSIDAFRPDYLDRGLTPNLVALARDGARAQYMLPSFPSLTFPNHYTLVTGRVPDHNGIVNNTMQDPVLGKFSLSNHAATSDGRWWAGAEPIWVTAQKHGLHTATMFWPGTEAEIHGVALAPSVTISTPRVAAAPIALECRLDQVIPFGRLKTDLLIGEVMLFRIDDALYRDGKIDSIGMRPLARLGGTGAEEHPVLVLVGNHRR